MTDLDRDVERLLADLWQTPVGRRWVLKAGLASLVVGLVGRPGAASASSLGGQRVASASAVATQASVAFQFALAELEGISGLVLVAGGQQVPLRPHTRATRASLRAQGGLWQSVDLAALSHFVDGVALPAHRTSLVRVEGRRGKQGVVVAEVWHAPEQATVRLAKASQQLSGTLAHVAGSTQRLEALGLGQADLRSALAVAQLETVGDNYQTATALTMTHPNVATVDPDAAAATKALLGQTPEVTTLGSYIGQMQRAGRDFATLDPALDADGTPTEIEVGGVRTTFSTIRLNDSDVKFKRNTRSALSAGITGVRDDADLGAVTDKPLDEDPTVSTKTWVQPEGVVAQPQPYGDHLQAQAGVEANLKNTGFLYGTRTVLRGGYADGKVPVKLYNNFVRWMWVYVQYLGADGKNLSANPNATFPDTKYSKAVCIVPQVFTVLGLPLWDTNTVEFTLEFPEGAHTARLLYCGLGSDILGGGWRQYFPADAYPGKVAPEDEVLVPALTTAIVTIGLTVFALAVDINIASTWSQVDKFFTEMAPPAMEAFNGVVAGAHRLPAVEAAAVTLASGGALYLDIEHAGENLDNLWGLLLGMGKVIVKLFFNPRVFFSGEGFATWTTVGRIIAENIGATKVTNALPVIGQYIAVASAVGDAVTLAEVGAETLVSPWVIENEVSLSYPVTVTVSRDPRAGTFPATARSWRLEALVDGAVGLAPITGQVNEGGKLRSAPLVLQLTAPFGGRSIQWSVVFLDADGVQVGTGVSAPYPNDDPAQPASAVAFAIEQVPAVVTSKTVFKRAGTLAYDTAAGGYTWSDQVQVTGTVSSGGVQEVAGAAVATMAGVGAMVWKEGDRYYLRGVPLAQDGQTVELRSAPKQGYARRPFLLLDAFVDPQDKGNHVLVEPDDTSSGYHVRMVSLDPVTGALSWDPAVSYGVFSLPVSACALHSSGRVVAVNTDSGRLGWLEPVDTPRPPLAAYVAGPGDQVGLLSSPVAVAVTNPGTVVVLEAAGRRLSTFDLNGNPVRYFGPGPELGFTLELVSEGTYLDLAVDGGEQVYVLYFTGDGAAPLDYHVDVYTKTGEPLATHSPGVNVPHLAVDYWRSVYGANYSALSDLGTNQPHIDAALKVKEPSFSRFDPTQAK